MAVAITPERLRRMEPVRAPREEYEDLAKLSAALRAEERTKECKLVGPHGESVVPEAVFHALARVVEVLAKGDAITIVPVGKELTTQQSADLLNVSRQYLVKLIEDGRIACKKTGRHRRLRIEDVLEFKRKRDEARQDELDHLIAMTEEADGYPELK